jgi:hypothetical protein
MLCPSCRSTLFAGAFECRFCGKKIPQPPSARLPGLVLIGVLLGIAGLVVWGGFFRTDAQQEEMRLRQAAACGTTTPDKLATAGRQMAAKSGIPVIDATHQVEATACPGMK